MLEWIVTGIVTFAATNVDDIVLLVMFFSQLNASFRPRHVVIGQYLGFSVLVGVSLLGFAGSLVVPRPVIGLLGLAPIGIGLYRLFQRNESVEQARDTAARGAPSLARVLLAPHTYQVASVTVANGGDNIGVYRPLFASATLSSLVVLLILFFVLVGVWCLMGYWLARHPALLAALTSQYGRVVVSFS